MSGQEQRELELELRALRAPDEAAATDRGLEVVRAAHADLRSPVPRRTASRLRIGLVLAGAAVVAIGLTPAGASVRDWISDTVEGADNPRPALSRLPSGGRMLVSSSGGLWTVDADGARRRIGPYSDGTWSPQGANIAATRDRQLVAVNPFGEVQWAISHRRRIADPRWAPSGVRVAFRSGDRLRVVWGNGINDALVASGVAAVAPAWRPPPRGVTPALDVLAYVDGDGTIVVRDVPTGQLLASTDLGFEPRFIDWLANGRLVAAGRRIVEVLDPDLERVASFAAGPPGSLITAIDASPAARRIGIVRERSGGGSVSSDLVSARIARTGTATSRSMFSGPGTFTTPTFSPDGTWLAAGWREADQWLFLRPAADQKLLRHVEAVDEIARQFDPARAGEARFPEIEGWCCAG